MATITTANNNSALNSSRRSYVAVKDFNNSDFAKYTVAMNASYVNVGTLSAVTTDADLAPKGRVLRENGRKLYPDANPGVTRYLVGVYDDKTGLSGFIDPNSPTFTLFNTDRPNYIPVDDKVDIGAPVYTAGSIEADGSATLNDGLSVTGGATVPSATITAATYTTGTGVLVYTAANSFVVGETVTVSGVTVVGGGGGAGVFNVTGKIASASGTQFTINSYKALTATTANNNTGTVTLVQPSLVVDSANTTVSGGLVLANGGFTQKVVVSTTAPSGVVKLDLTQGNVFYFSTAMVDSASVNFTTSGAVVGSTYYITFSTFTNPGNITFTGNAGATNLSVTGVTLGGGSSVLALGVLGAGQAVTPAASKPYTFTCIVLAA